MSINYPGIVAKDLLGFSSAVKINKTIRGTLKLGSHYPCSRAVRETRAVLVTRAVVLLKSIVMQCIYQHGP